MGRHRTHPPGRRVAPPTRPRYGRIGAASVAVVVTVLAVLGGVGVLPTSSVGSTAYAASASGGGAGGSAKLAGVQVDAKADAKAGAKADRETKPGAPSGTTGGAEARRAMEATARAERRAARALPADSGSGRRVVFDMGEQRVWLVDVVKGKEVVRRSYPVSGSVTDNLDAGSYTVYSRSLHAVGIDDSGTMDFMVRFAQGDNAAIGFHDVPVKDGELVQTRSQLGTAQSHGCVRQWRDDAKALWKFAPYGTTVVVTA